MKLMQSAEADFNTMGKKIGFVGIFNTFQSFQVCGFPKSDFVCSGAWSRENF